MNLHDKLFHITSAVDFACQGVIRTTRWNSKACIEDILMQNVSGRPSWSFYTPALLDLEASSAELEDLQRGLHELAQSTNFQF
jgi:hypothetical protein